MEGERDMFNIISVVFTFTDYAPFTTLRNTEMLITRKCLTVIELAEMGLHGTFGNLHTYLLFRAVQLQSVSGGVSGPAAHKPLPFPSALLGDRDTSVKWLLILSPICPAQSLL